MNLFFSWGLTTLLVDANDIMPENITEATDDIDHINLMPAYGLNVHSMLKHKNLVLTLDALNHIEDKLLFALNRIDRAEVRNKIHGKWSNYPSI
jgi:large subunit ribosomal protein L4